MSPDQSQQKPGGTQQGQEGGQSSGQSPEQGRNPKDQREGQRPQAEEDQVRQQPKGPKPGEGLKEDSRHGRVDRDESGGSAQGGDEDERS